MKTLILAAGYSTRLYPLTRNTPKALLPIGGRPMLDYLTDRIVAAGIAKEGAIVTNHRFAGDFECWAKTRSDLSLRVLDDMTSSDDEKLGAVGDIAFALSHCDLDDDLLVCACDNYATAPLDGFLADFRRHGRDTLLARKIDSIEDLRRFAVATLDKENRVISLTEKPAEPQSDVAVYALYFYRRDTLPLFRTYLDAGGNPDAPGHFPEWLCTRRDVRAYVYPGELIDIGTPESYRAVCHMYEGKETP